MSEMINGKRPEQVKAALCICTGGGCSRYTCAYEADGDCSGSVMRDALELVKRLEARVAKQDELLAALGVSIPEEVG